MQCTATRRDGEPCRTPAVKGATVCRMHGGSSPQVKQAAKQNLLQVKLNGELQSRGWEPVANPEAALLNVAGEVLAWLAICREHLAELNSLDYTGALGAKEIQPVVALYERAQDRASGTLGKLVQLGIQDRVARSQELTAEANLAAMRNLIRQARANPDASEDELVLGLLSGAL